MTNQPLLGRAAHRHVFLVACSVVSAMAFTAATAGAQIRVHPTGVNVNAQGATTVLLTFGGLSDYRPVEALWCRSLVPAAPDVGLRCDPSTILGSLPVRYDQSRVSGQSVFTDIMSIPASVSRRAYQAAEAGGNSGFFYVRRFARTGGGPEQYVAVTCRMSGGGARDLLTEGSLPPDERGLQRRYTDVGRFNVFLSPGTRSYTLPGPDPRRLPTNADGTYYVLLRVEVADDKEGDSNLAAAGAGTGIVHSGAVAGFPMPPLRYVVGSARTPASGEMLPDTLSLVTPAENAVAPPTGPIDLSWTAIRQASVYRVEIETANGVSLHSAFVDAGVPQYRLPSWLRDRAPADGRVRWRVVATDAAGRDVGTSAWRALTIAKESPL